MPLDTDTLFERRQLKRRLSLWRALAVLAVLGAGFYLLGGDEWLDDDAGVFARPHVARIHLDEVIVEDRDRQEALERIARNDNVRALIVHVSTPGGSTYGAEEIYLALRRIGEQRPVVAVIGTIGTSGGYLAALAAERIFARESSITGSVGVLFQATEVSGLMEKVGVRAETITSGPLKAEPSPFKPLSEQARSATQAMVNETHAWFAGLVAERRGLKDEQLRLVSDGGIFIGRRALGLGLIDELGGESEARTWLARQKGVEEGLPARTLDWRRPGDDWRGMLLGSIAGLFGKTILTERLKVDGLMSVWHPER